MDEKMKKMGDMQLSTVTDAKKRKTILEQVQSGGGGGWYTVGTMTLQMYCKLVLLYVYVMLT